MIKGYKGFNKDLKCRDYQFEVGKQYTEKGDVKACAKGFHFCKNPFDVFNYYPPADSRFAKVTGCDKTDTDNDDSKVACSRIKIEAEIGLPGLIKAGVEYIKEQVNWDDDKETNTGNQSAATNTGNRSAATNTGDWSAATNTGNWSAATVEGKESVAISLGVESKAKGTKGCWIVLSEWKLYKNNDWHRINVQCLYVDGKKIKADTFYVLQDGKAVALE